MAAWVCIGPFDGQPGRFAREQRACAASCCPSECGLLRRCGGRKPLLIRGDDLLSFDALKVLDDDS
jgi:hypothetical protein